MDNLKSVLMRLQSVVIFVPDREIQKEIEKAIVELQQELYNRVEK